VALQAAVQLKWVYVFLSLQEKIVLVRSDMFGQWKLVGNPCVGATEMEAANTFQSQGSFVLPMPGRPGSFIFMADQWDPDNLAESR